MEENGESFEIDVVSTSPDEDRAQAGDPTAASSSKSEKRKLKRLQYCAKCRNHGILIRVKDHKRWCRYEDCPCSQCCLISERREVMKLQVAVRRAQDQDIRLGLAYFKTKEEPQNEPLATAPPPVPPVPQEQATTPQAPPHAFKPMTGGASPADRHQLQEQLQTLMQAVLGCGSIAPTTLCLYIILKDSRFNTNEAYSKIMDAQTDMRTIALRSPTAPAPSAANNYWPPLLPQNVPPSTSPLMYSPLSWHSSYYPYSFPPPNSPAAVAVGAGPPNGTHSPLNSTPIHSFCTYMPNTTFPAVGPPSAGLGGPGPPLRLVEVASSGDSRGSDCRDESDKEGPSGPSAISLLPPKEGSSPPSSVATVQRGGYQPSFNFTSHHAGTRKKYETSVDS